MWPFHWIDYGKTCKLRKQKTRWSPKHSKASRKHCPKLCTWTKHWWSMLILLWKLALNHSLKENWENWMKSRANSTHSPLHCRMPSRRKQQLTKIKYRWFQHFWVELFFQELHDAENSLTAIGTCFSHTGLDYVAQINIAHALKCPAILEALWVFVKEHGNFFNRGAHFFDDQQEFMIGDAIASMRTSYKQIERQMQNRHTIVPKVRKFNLLINLKFRKYFNTRQEFQQILNA